MVAMLKSQVLPMTAEMEMETNLICIETRSIVDKIIELGGGDIAIGAIRSFEAGVIDIPFAPSQYNLGRVIPARDNEGAVRFLDHGNLPFNEDIIAFHKSKMEQRSKCEKRAVSYQMVIDDIYAISKGRLVGRPK
jgi:methylaspartate mutase epsilon subunit